LLQEEERFPSSAARRSELALRVGQTLRLRVIELDYEPKRARANILSTLRSGDICEGQVTNLCDFGAFVDLGGVEGLIHISELSWGRVEHPRDVLRRGERVKVYVIDVQPEQGRIALSLKRLQPDPWATMAQRYRVRQIVEGVITNVVDFGAFARVEEGLEGLIHISELAEGNFLHPRNVVREGERVRVLSVDGSSRRLSLSLRRLEGDLSKRLGQQSRSERTLEH
jgi:small subunit ribosomal protein S1